MTNNVLVDYNIDMSRLKPHLIPLLTYILLAIFFTWPLLSNILTAYPSAVEWHGGDVNIYLWQIDTAAKYFTGNLSASPEKLLFYPQGINLSAGYEGMLLIVLAAPIAAIFKNPVLAYNLVVLLALWGAAAAGYGLCYFFTRSRLPSFLSGFIFGLSPFLLVRATQHAYLVFAAVLPLLVWTGIKFIRMPSYQTGLWLAAATGLTALAEWYYLMAGGIFLLIVFAVRFKLLFSKKLVLTVTIILMITAALMPAIPLLRARQFESLPGGREYSARLRIAPANLVLPHPFTNVFGPKTVEAYKKFPSSLQIGVNYFESTSYLGLPLLVLLIIFAVYHKRLLYPEKKLFVLSAGIILILAIGTELKIFEKTLHLPYYYLVEYFPFSLFRATNRFFIMVLLLLSILACMAMQYLYQSIEKKRVIIATAALVIVLAAERLMLPFPLLTKHVPGFYQLLAKNPQQFAVADLPIVYPGYTEYNYFQLTHGKPLVAAAYYYPSYNQTTFRYILQNPLLHVSFCGQESAASITVGEPARVLADLAKDNIRYVVMHNFTLHDDRICTGAAERIREFLQNQEPLLTDGEITVYETNRDLSQSR